MQLITRHLKSLNIGWNERPLTEADFYRLCRKFSVRVTEMPLRVGGFHYRMLGRDFIAVDSRLGRTERLAVLFHELGHFLLHAPESSATASFHHIGRQTRQEQEADLFAYCCLIPRAWIESHHGGDIAEYDGIPHEIVAARYEIYRRYNV